ncbi:MAG: hypothetical protein N3C12_14290 [Candidatus Binatia bacterium]|nr:hypothetical protein [Candidatus Binatia bacterium]
MVLLPRAKMATRGTAVTTPSPIDVFPIRYSPFAVSHHSPLATRHSLLADPFATRGMGVTSIAAA